MLRSRILMKLEFSGHIFEKYSNIIFDESPSSGSRVVPCGQTDGQKDRRKKQILILRKRIMPTVSFSCSLDVSTTVNKKYGWNL